MVYVPVIPAAHKRDRERERERERERVIIQVISLVILVSSKITRAKRFRSMSQAIQHLCSKQEARISNTSKAKTTTKKGSSVE
jgi:hypothetical protein